MRRTWFACCITALLTAGLTSPAVFGSTIKRLVSTNDQLVTAPAGTTVRFTGGVDLLCVSELPSGAPQHLNQRGVACTSDASPYLHVALWITRTRVTLTRPAYTHTIYTVIRR